MLFLQKEKYKKLVEKKNAQLLVQQVRVEKKTAELESARNKHKEEMAEKQRVIETYETKVDTLLSEVDDDSSGRSSAPWYFVCPITKVSSEATHSAL